MPLLVRKIDYPRWDHDVLSGPLMSDISADAITDLKTKSNTLSVWYAASDDEVEEAVLAIVGTLTQLDAIDLIPLEQSALQAAGLELQEDTGRTWVKSMEKRHRNIVKLTYGSLGTIAGIVVDRIREYTEKDKRIRITVSEVRDILKKAISEKRLDLNDLPDSIRKKITSQ